MIKRQLTAIAFVLTAVAVPSSPFAHPPVDYTAPVITCSPKPACLDSNPPCEIAEPIAGWCSEITPNPTCIPRPACLDANPPCKLQVADICPPSPTLTPTPFTNPFLCGGNKPVICPSGYTCLYGKDAAKGGKCVPIITPALVQKNKDIQIKQGFLKTVWNFIISFFKH